MYKIIDFPEKDYSIITENGEPIARIDYDGSAPDRIHWYREPTDRIAVEQEFRRCTRECGYEMSLSQYLEV